MTDTRSELEKNRNSVTQLLRAAGNSLECEVMAAVANEMSNLGARSNDDNCIRDVLRRIAEVFDKYRE